LHPAQDEDEQPPHPDFDGPADAPLDDFPMPKRDMSFSVLREPHCSQATSAFDPKTSFSKSAPQALQ
jgi:hypothetical protein